MKMNKGYEIDFVNEQIVVSKVFLKAASTLGTPEYRELQELRQENPGFPFVQREITKKEGKKAYRNLNYKNMREYIIAREGEKSAVLDEFDMVRALSKVQAGPYAYVKAWFLNRYGSEFNPNDETAVTPEAV